MVADARTAARRIGAAFPSDVRRASVHRLEHRVVDADIGGLREPEPADQHRGLVAQDVAEQVRRHDHAKPFGRSNQLHSARIDEHFLRLDVGKLLCDFERHAAEQAARFPQYVRLVNDRH